MLIIKDGELFRLVDGKEVKYRSEFIKDKEEMIARSEKFSGWKHADEEPGSGGMVPRAMLWGGRKLSRELPKFIHAQQDERGFYFVLEMTRAGGLFHYDTAKDEEVRHFHREGFVPYGFHVAGEALYAALASPDGAIHLYAFDRNGRDEVALTSGDTRDQNPWVHDGIIHYDSAGIGRSQDGSPAMSAPRCICRIDTKGGEHRVVRESPHHDYILPKVDPKGALYALRLPYEPHGRYSLWARAVDVVMFPVTLAQAVLGFINAFTMMFAKKPIMTSGGPRVPAQDLRRRLIHAKLVDLQASTRSAGRRVAAPETWQLVRLDGPADVVVASNVIGYGFDAQGELVLNEGFGISRVQAKPFHVSEGLISVVA